MRLSRSRPWIHDVERGTLTPFSRRDANTVAFVWSRDGEELFYNVETPVYDVYRRRAGGAGGDEALSAGRIAPLHP